MELAPREAQKAFRAMTESRKIKAEAAICALVESALQTLRESASTQDQFFAKCIELKYILPETKAIAVEDLIEKYELPCSRSAFYRILDDATTAISKMLFGPFAASFVESPFYDEEAPLIVDTEVLDEILLHEETANE